MEPREWADDDCFHCGGALWLDYHEEADGDGGVYTCEDCGEAFYVQNGKVLKVYLTQEDIERVHKITGGEVYDDPDLDAICEAAQADELRRMREHGAWERRQAQKQRLTLVK